MRFKFILTILLAGAVLIFFIFKSSSPDVKLSPHSEQTRVFVNSLIVDQFEPNIIASYLNLWQGLTDEITNKQYPYSALEGLKKNAPEWEIDVGSNFIPSPQNLENLTYPELLKYAKGTNSPEAWLQLVAISKPIDFSLPESERLRQCRIWVEQIENSDYPGIDFLLEVLSRLNQDLFKEKSPLPFPDGRGTTSVFAGELEYNLKKGKNFTKDPSLPDFNKDEDQLQLIPGYEEFRLALKEGNYFLFQAISALVDIDENSPLSRHILEGLRKKTLRGDKTALIHLAQVEFKFLIFLDDPADSTSSLNYTIENEKAESRHDFILYLSDLLEGIVTIRKEKNYSETLQRLTAITRDLRQEAHKGNKDAMYLWLVYGTFLHQPFTPDVWKDMHDFSDILLRSGHTRFLREFIACHDLYRAYENEIVPFMPGLLSLSYSDESYRKIAYAAKWFLYRRQDDIVIFPALETSHSKYLASTLSNKDKSLLKHLVDNPPPRLIQLPRIYAMLYQSGESEKDKAKIITALECLAMEDNYIAKFALADLLLYSGKKEEEIEKIISLFEESWELGRECRDKIYILEVGEPFRYLPLAQLVLPWLADLYLNKNSTHYNLTDAARILREIKTYHDIHYRNDLQDYKMRELSWAFYYLGRMYEDGIGVPKDAQKAAKLYAQWGSYALKR